MRRPGFALVILALVSAFALAGGPAYAQEATSEIGHGWLPEFSVTSRQLLQLAEAMPAGKYGWRPGPGVRSVSEVYMHVALGNFWLLQQAGAKLPADLGAVPNDEKQVTEKAQVIAWLRKALDAARDAYQRADRTMRVQFFGRETTADGVFLRILLHDNEHMGQAVAYARMNGVVPPWSR